MTTAPFLDLRLPLRFWDKVQAVDTGCWLWRGARSNGYGRLKVAGRTCFAHRLAYIRLVGAVPPGLQIDHLCRVRECVNPAHLEAVTARTNILRGESPVAKNARKRLCPRGHELAGVNLAIYLDRQGRQRRTCRRCRTCGPVQPSAQ